MSGLKQKARLHRDIRDRRRVQADLRRDQADPEFLKRCQAEFDAEDGRPIQQRVADDLRDPAMRARAFRADRALKGVG